MRLYKYRDVGNLARTLDIVINKRLYAARFSELNDPMEGIFRHPPGSLAARDLWKIRDDKLRLRIASLSRNHKSTLMWSYYAGGHSGICIGLIVARGAKPVKVIYDNSPEISKLTGRAAAQILSHKLHMWGHEEEYRVLLNQRQTRPGNADASGTFVAVRVEEIILGRATDANVAAIVRAVAAKYCPSAPVRTIAERELR